VEGVAFHARHEFHHAVIADVADQAVDDGVAQLAVGHLAALKAERSLHFVAVLQETNRLVLAGHIVVVVDGDGELDFLNSDDLLALAGGAVALFLFVKELAVILNAADRRNRRGRDFYQIEPALASDLQSFKRGEDAELLTLFVDYPNFPGPDTLINSDKLLRRTLIDGFFSSSVAEATQQFSIPTAVEVRCGKDRD
jgi:hypothetical protein